MGGEKYQKCFVTESIKVKLNKVVRPAMLYKLEMVPLMKRLEVELEAAQLKMLRFGSDEDGQD